MSKCLLHHHADPTDVFDQDCGSPSSSWSSASQTPAPTSVVIQSIEPSPSTTEWSSAPAPTSQWVEPTPSSSVSIWEAPGPTPAPSTSWVEPAPAAPTSTVWTEEVEDCDEDEDVGAYEEPTWEPEPTFTNYEAETTVTIPTAYVSYPPILMFAQLTSRSPFRLSSTLSLRPLPNGPLSPTPRRNGPPSPRLPLAQSPSPNVLRPPSRSSLPHRHRQKRPLLLRHRRSRLSQRPFPRSKLFPRRLRRQAQRHRGSQSPALSSTRSADHNSNTISS